MADDIDLAEQGNDSPLEGGEEIFSAIDSVLEGNHEQTQETQTETTQETQQTETPPEQAQETVAPEKKSEQQQTQTEEKQYPAEIKSPKARHHFDVLSQKAEAAERRAKEAEGKIKAFETQIQELQSKSGTAAPEVKVLQKQVSDLQAQLDEREKIISFKAVEETKPFREEVTAPMTKAEDTMDKIAAQYGLDINKINAVLLEKNEFKRFEMLGDMTEIIPERSSLVKGKLQEAVDKWIAADEKRAELYQNAKGNREFAEQEKAQEEARTALQRQQEFKNAEKEVIGKLTPKFPEIFGDAELSKSIMDKASKVTDFDRLPAQAKVFANWTSWAFMPLAEKYRAQGAELKKANEIIASRNKSTPSAAGGRGSLTTGNNGDTEGDETDPMAGIMGGLDSVLGSR